MSVRLVFYYLCLHSGYERVTLIIEVMQLFWGRNWNGKITMTGSKDKILNSKQSAGDQFFG